MSILDFLFRKAKKPYSPPSSINSEASANANVSEDWLFEIPKLGIFVEFSKSPSGQWVICWRDSNDQGTRGGHRESGKGSYVLYNTLQKQVVLKGKLERPNSGHVADNGTFSIEDWGFGGGLSGTFYVFSSAGVQLIKKSLEANIFNSAISSGGRYAICQTANNPGSADGNQLIAFDVEGRVQLFSVSPETGWAYEYRFLEEGPYFCLSIKDVGTFRYDKSGSFVDRAGFETAKLNSRRHDLYSLRLKSCILRSPLDSGFRRHDECERQFPPSFRRKPESRTAQQNELFDP